MSTQSVLFDAPGPRARIRHAISGVVISLVLLAVLAYLVWRLAAKGQFTAVKWKPFLTGEIWTSYLLSGILGTLEAAAIAVVLAAILGVLLGVGRLSQNAPIRWVAGVFTEFFRAVPVLMMMFFAFAVYGRFGLVPSNLLALAATVTGLTFYNGSVIAELIRSGVQSLPRGQREAGLSLGLGHLATLRYVLLPQAITAMLPSLISQLVVVLKDTALGYNVTYDELLNKASQIGNYKQNLIPAFMVVAVLFIVINYTIARLAGTIERRLRGRGIQPQTAVEEQAPLPAAQPAGAEWPTGGEQPARDGAERRDPDS
jgi:glutamate transport system permease protein